MNDPATSNFGLTQIGQIAVPVSDIDRAVAFYRDTLGCDSFIPISSSSIIHKCLIGRTARVEVSPVITLLNVAQNLADQ